MFISIILLIIIGIIAVYFAFRYIHAKIENFIDKVEVGDYIQTWTGVQKNQVVGNKVQEKIIIQI